MLVHVDFSPMVLPWLLHRMTLAVNSLTYEPIANLTTLRMKIFYIRSPLLTFPSQADYCLLDMTIMAVEFGIP